MKILFYSTRPYDKISFREKLDKYKGLDVEFIESPLDEIHVELAKGYDAVCIFTNDCGSKKVIERLAELGVKYIALRCAGFDNVDWKTANKLGITVFRVPAYSPESVAEHAMTLATAVNRHIHKAYTRIRDNNFSLSELSAFCLHGKTAGIIGYGKIGKALANICKGYGMKVTAYDPYFKPTDETDKTENVDLNDLYQNSDFIFLTTLLNDSTYHMINKAAISKMKKDVILVNVSRGALIDTQALMDGIRAKKFFGVGLDVYEGEEQNVYRNHQDDILQNQIVQELLGFPNVIITSHQAFLTDVSLEQIATSVCTSLYLAETGQDLIESCVVK